MPLAALADRVSVSGPMPRLSLAFALVATLVASPAAATLDEPPTILVSRQLLEGEGLKVGEVVSLSVEASGAKARSFRVAGTYEPTPDPTRLGSKWLEARLHLPDLLALTQNRSEPLAMESVGTINIRLADPRDADAFARDLSARLPGLVIRPAVPTGDEVSPFVVLERFHFAIALVTVVASTMFLLALMVMLVDERRETIAVLRLIGLRRSRILLQVLVEGLVIAVAGAAFGVLLAMLFQGGFNRFFQWRYDTALVFVRVTPQLAWRSVLLAVPLGLLASAVSSWGLLRRGAIALARR